jgi:glycosyltransferase involved in cell wall biosynthesis
MMGGLCLLLVLVQYYFFVRYFGKLAAFQIATPNLKYKPVSVIVCVRNNMHTIKPLIENLLAQKMPLYEIIMVDDRSGDEVYDYLLTMKYTYPNFRMTRIEETPDRMNAKKFALTLGIKAARFDHVLLTDDDCLPRSENWIRQMQLGFQDNKSIVLGYSPYKRYPGLLNTLIRYETFYTGIQYLSIALGGHPYMGIGRNLAYTKELFFSYKGFYKHISVNGGDDDLFINRTASPENVAIVITPESMVESEPKLTWKGWYKQKLRHFSVGSFYKGEDLNRLALLGNSYIFFWVSLIILCCLQYGWLLAVPLFLIRSIGHTIYFWRCGKKLNEKFPWLLLPFIDFIYLWCFLFFNFRAGTKRKISW